MLQLVGDVQAIAKPLLDQPVLPRRHVVLPVVQRQEMRICHLGWARPASFDVAMGLRSVPRTAF